VTDDVLELVRAGGLLAPGRPVVAMLSGGRDSVCLLDVAVTLTGADAVQAVHVNYGLRAAADVEQRACEELCARLGVSLVAQRAGPPPPGNLQAWARGVRYSLAHREAGRRRALIATGHTATDQAETVLYRLAASPGRRALLGMRPREGDVIRPLLAVSREQTAEHCRRRGLGWCEDASNQDHLYARARVRGGLSPVLRSIHPAAEANVVRTAELLREEGDVLDAVVEAELEGAEGIALDRLAELPPALARLLCRRLAEDAAGRLVSAAPRRLEEILALPRAGSASLDLGGGLRAVVEYGRLRFVQGTPAPLPPHGVALPVPGQVRFGDRVIDARLGPAHRRQGVLAAEALVAPLVVRRWRSGDRMAPLGLGGTRSLQDLFTDRRVPREQRLRTPVVESGGEVAWVPGVATAERFRVTAQTRQAVHLSAAPAT
jgi:tRNA(Ile)-lysidine synthase